MNVDAYRLPAAVDFQKGGNRNPGIIILAETKQFALLFSQTDDFKILVTYFNPAADGVESGKKIFSYLSSDYANIARASSSS